MPQHPAISTVIGILRFVVLAYIAVFFISEFPEFFSAIAWLGAWNTTTTFVISFVAFAIVGVYDLTYTFSNKSMD